MQHGIMARMADWRDPHRVRALATIAAILQALVLAFLIAGTHGWIVPLKKPTTTDYVSFYAAGALANAGHAQAAYDDKGTDGGRSLHWHTEEAATAPGIDYQYFFNPPTYLLIMAPFARLPYLISFLTMQALTLTLWLALGTRVAGGGFAAAASLLAVPSLWWAMGLGQNSFLSASLLAAGTLLLPARPVLAGIAFGALCYKPHLGLMVPVALLAAREWRAICSATITVVSAVGASALLYGVAAWQAFLIGAQRSVAGPIDSGKVLLAGRIDPTGALQEMGLSAHGARLIWLGCLLLVVSAVAWLWRRGGRDARNAGLVAAVVIAAPFVLMYDLVTASLAAAWIVRAGRARGFLAGEKAAIALIWLADILAAHPIVAATHVPFGAMAGPVLLALACRRGFVDTRHTRIDVV